MGRRTNYSFEKRQKELKKKKKQEAKAEKRRLRREAKAAQAAGIDPGADVDELSTSDEQAESGDGQADEADMERD